MNTFIGIKKLWYGDVINTITTMSPSVIDEFKAAMTEVTNVHEDTWGYEESDPETTEYNNELTGQPYYIDNVKQGQPTISFTLGEYEYQQKADLQGGAVINDSNSNPIGWSRPTSLETIYKSVLALSKTGVYILFPKAQITAKGDVQEKNIGLGIQAKAVEIGGSVATEYWVKSSDSAVRYTYTAVNSPSGNPHALGYYVLAGDGYVLTNDTTVDSNKTYYTRTESA